MFFDKMPKILFNAWLWIGIAAVLIVIHYFFGKAPKPHKINPFFEKHNRTFNRIMDIFLIVVMLFGWILWIYMSISMSVEFIFKYTHIPTNILLKDSIGTFAIGATALSGGSAISIGLLSVFQSNLTKNKRLILASVSMLPVGFTTLAVLTVLFDNPEAIWTMVRICLWSLVSCCIFNGPAIIMGKHLIRFVWDIMRKLRLVSGDYPG